MSLDVAPAPRAVVGTVGRLRRLLRAGFTTPERLRRVAVGLVAGCLLTAVVSVLGGLIKTHAVHQSAQIAGLSNDAADLYRSLADADATATKGYVSAGPEPAEVRIRYDGDIDHAAHGVVQAADQLPAGDPAVGPVMRIGTQLPVYTGLMETARTYKRQGLPLGQTYLNNASNLMREMILHDAEQLRDMQTEALTAEYQRGGAPPLPVLLIGVAVLAGMVDHAVLEHRRTKRVFNLGLLAAGAALVAALVWWAVAAVYIGERLEVAQRHSDAEIAPADARVAALKARSNESLVLARSGSGLTDDGFTTSVGSSGGLLTKAVRDDPDAADQIAKVRITFVAWEVAHQHVRDLDNDGQYQQAVASVTGAGPMDSGATFDHLDEALGIAIDSERKVFMAYDGSADSALAGLPIGPAVLALLAAGLVAAGIGQRVAEYR